VLTVHFVDDDSVSMLDMCQSCSMLSMQTMVLLLSLSPAII